MNAKHISMVLAAVAVTVGMTSCDKVVDESINYISYSKMTPYGQLKVEISHKDFSGTMTVTVPVGTSATVWVPGSETSSIVYQGVHEFKF